MEVTTPFFVGGGSEDPSVWVVLPDGRTETIGTLRDRGAGYAVYGLAVSPSGTRVVAGTRPILDPAGRVVAPGVLRAWAADAPGPPRFERFEMSGVLELCFLDEDSVAVACGDGQLRAYDLRRPERPLWQVQAHQGAVLTCVTVGPLVVSYGADGAYRAWTHVGAPANLPPLMARPPGAGAMCTLAADGARGLVWTGDGDGFLGMIPVNPAFQPLRAQAHRGEILSVAWLPGPDVVVSGGHADGQIAVWDSTTLAAVRRFDVGAGVAGIVAFAEDAFAVFDVSGRMTRWSVDGRSLGAPVRIPARAWAAPSVAAGLVERKAAAEAERGARVQRLERAVQAGQLGAHAEDIDALRADGAPEWVLFAALEAREAGRHLDELAVWTQVEEELEGLPPAWAYLVAENREALHDFEGAAARFRALGAYEDSPTRAVRCEGRPSIRALVRGDVRVAEQLTEEAARATLLGHGLSTPIVVWAPEPEPLPAALDVSYVQRRVEELAAIHGRPLRATVEEGAVWTGREVVGVRWVRVSGDPDDPDTVHASLAAGQPSVGQQWAMYCLFEPPAPSVDVKAHNAAVVEAWNGFVASPKVRAWMDLAAQVTRKAVEEARNQSVAAVAAPESDGGSGSFF
jgi:hypothetical protein